MLIRCAQRLRPFGRVVNALRHTASTNKAQTEESASNFSEFVADLVQDTKTVDNSLHKNVKVFVRNYEQLYELVESIPPSNAAECAQVLSRLVAFVKEDTTIKYQEWITSENFVSAMHSKLMDPSADTSTVLLALSNLLHLVDKQAYKAVAEDGRLVPTIGGLINELIERVDNGLVQKFGEIELDSVINLVAECVNTSCPLKKEFKDKLLNLLARKVNDVVAPYQLIRLWNLKEVCSDPIMKQKLEAKVDELLPIMSTGEMVNIFVIFAEIGNRNFQLLQSIAESLRLRPGLTANQVVKLLSAMEKLSFRNARLLIFVENQILQSLHDFKKWNQLTTLIYSLTKLKVNSKKLWFHLCQWITEHEQSSTLSERSFALSACATMNVPPELLSSTAQKLGSIFTPNKAKTPAVWLNTLHSLAILNEINTRTARTVQESTFLDELTKGANDDLTFFRFQKVLQILSSIRFDKGEKLAIPDQVVEFIMKQDSEFVFRQRHGKTVEADAKEFYKNLNLVANLNTHVTPTHINVETGAIIDGIVLYDKKQKKILPKAAEINVYVQQVAIIYATYNNLTKSTGQDEDIRVNGELAMNCRHLRKLGFRPVVIKHYDLLQFSDNLDKIKFIREKIMSEKTESYVPTLKDFK